ncbi:hypothetical protein [Methylorubrum thiocyanatum]|uniref:hypothetical protein n=1 Tax=Methylorubrum thiocyanatum TaxID=47958 RepID=UPI0035C830D9
MVFPDAKWLDFLKAGLPASLGLAVGCGATVYLNREGLLPAALPETIALAIAVAGLISGGLALSLLLAAIYRASVWFVKPRYEGHLYKRLDAKRKREFTKYTPYLSPKERQIFGFLLHYNRRTFTNTSDCGYAAELLSLGYVQMIGRGRQHVDYWSVPFGVPESVWEALEENRDAFLYVRQQASYRDRGYGEPEPWRKPGAP